MSLTHMQVPNRHGDQHLTLITLRVAGSLNNTSLTVTNTSNCTGLKTRVFSESAVQLLSASSEEVQPMGFTQVQ